MCYKSTHFRAVMILGNIRSIIRVENYPELTQIVLSLSSHADELKTAQTVLSLTHLYLERTTYIIPMCIPVLIEHGRGAFRVGLGVITAQLQMQNSNTDRCIALELLCLCNV